MSYVRIIGSSESSRICKTVDGGGHWDPQFADTDPKVLLDANGAAPKGIAASVREGIRQRRDRVFAPDQACIITAIPR